MKRCVSAVIKDKDGNILIQDHKKLQRYTLPGGKAHEFEYDKMALIRELFEELGIMVYRYNELFTEEYHDLEYPANSGTRFNFTQVFYEITQYEGDVINKEPEKHPKILWVNPNKIRDIGPISVVLDSYLKHIGL